MRGTGLSVEADEADDVKMIRAVESGEGSVTEGWDLEPRAPLSGGTRASKAGSVDVSGWKTCTPRFNSVYS